MNAVTQESTLIQPDQGGSTSMNKKWTVECPEKEIRKNRETTTGVQVQKRVQEYLMSGPREGREGTYLAHNQCFKRKGRKSPQETHTMQIYKQDTGTQEREPASTSLEGGTQRIPGGRGGVWDNVREDQIGLRRPLPEGNFPENTSLSRGKESQKRDQPRKGDPVSVGSATRRRQPTDVYRGEESNQRKDLSGDRIRKPEETVTGRAANDEESPYKLRNSWEHVGYEGGGEQREGKEEGRSLRDGCKSLSVDV
ncbi:hypothetical protein C922_04692 [Plasmodium inui San Antonio 1]|uniref:Uncharacterized protein n=1 Tax=Plasmodium inui San Antonio 1 TaxID=1237626 RepID=W7A069_9APIC|nr:hypothetical protein C922_04692 [Plasmodium inui San Antonio 1]EUD64960.1 hypothetical protein C922_04692 [Plasmodium inui San Antonio 1]